MEVSSFVIDCIMFSIVIKNNNLSECLFFEWLCFIAILGIDGKRVSCLREKIINVINQINDEVKLTTIYKFILGLTKKAEK